MPAAILVSGLFIFLIWATDLVVSGRNVAIDFLLLRKPYRQAELGPLGPVFLAYLALLGLGLFGLWLRFRRQKGVPSIMIVSVLIWLLLGLEDAITNVWTGVPPLIPTAEYGFLGFCAAVLTITLRDYVALFDLAESRQRSLERAKSEAERANVVKSVFLANMSHELRTPLNHVIGFTELVATGRIGPINTNQAEYLGDALASSRHLLLLLNDILDLAKMESGKIRLELAEIRVEAVLRECLTVIQDECIKRSIIVGTRFESLPQGIHADARRLKQIMFNLLHNAVKFTPDGGRIELAARPVAMAGGQGIEVSVSDTGIGLSRADQERIFRPFEQVESSTSRIYPGTGLGLSVSRELVQLHGGRIWVESGGLGAGSIFRFVIPTDQSR
jgi:signal transduction histidine kinase